MPKTLLLADDSVVIQKLVGLSFANEDIELVTTDNGDDALTRAREIQPDLVLADVVMPGKNGYEVCEAIKTDSALGHIPVLLLTGTFEAFDEDRARQVGSNGHITKPFEAQGLVDRVTDLLSQAPPAPVAAAPVSAAPGPAVAAAPQPQVASPSDSSLQTPLSTTGAPVENAYDFFDDNPAQDLGASQPAAPAAPSPPSMPLPSSPSAPNTDSQFEFGSDLDPLAATGPGMPGGTESLDTGFEFESAGDLTVAVPADAMSGGQADSLPGFSMPDVPRFPADSAPDLSADLDAADATQVALGETMITEDLAGPSAEPTPVPVTSLDDSLREPPPVPGVDLEASTVPPAVPADPGLTMLADDLFDDGAPAAPEATVAPEAPKAITDSGFEFGFEDTNPEAAPVAQLDPEPRLESTDEMDPLADMSRDPFGTPPIPVMEAEPPSFAPPSFADLSEPSDSGYDVSVSDLGVANDEPEAAPQIMDVLPNDSSETSVPEAVVADEPAAAVAAETVGPDLSPMMRDRIHETLEKIAWEAFADVSDSIVRQVLQRVESIVWEVVPQMAETLIEEEIRKMKGEE